MQWPIKAVTTFSAASARVHLSLHYQGPVRRNEYTTAGGHRGQCFRCAHSSPWTRECLSWMGMAIKQEVLAKMAFCEPEFYILFQVVIFREMYAVPVAIQPATCHKDTQEGHNRVVHVGGILRSPTNRVPCEWAILELDLQAPDKPSETIVFSDILMPTSQETLSQNHPVKSFSNSWPTETDIKYLLLF